MVGAKIGIRVSMEGFRLRLVSKSNFEDILAVKKKEKQGTEKHYNVMITNCNRHKECS